MKDTSLKCMDIYSSIVILCVILLFMSYIPEMPFASLYDDLVGAIFLVIFFIGLLKRNRVPKQVINVWKILLILSTLGIVSNIFNIMDRTMNDIILDLFSFWKIFLVYAGTATIIYNKANRECRVLTFLSFIAKWFIVVAFVFGLLNLVGYVNMSDGERFDIKMYSFYFGNASQFGVFVGSSLAFIILAGKENFLFEAMGLATLFMTAKGMSFVIAVTYITLRIISGHKTVKIWQIILVLLVLLLAVQFQVNNYLLNEDAPRALMINYGLKTATDYFPLGAGWGMFGSNIAIEHYSPLYMQYGFEYIPSLAAIDETGKSLYLNDVYFGMILGQFGYLGLIVFAYIIYQLARDIFKNVVGGKKKHIVIACFACMCGMFVMAGSVKTQPGEILMMVIALYCCAKHSSLKSDYCDNNTEN